MAITDLTGYTWVGNEVIATGDIAGDIEGHFEISFKSGASEETTYELTPWKEIYITGGADATNSDLIAWLEENGTLTKGGGGGNTLDVTYNSQKIIDSLEVVPPVTVTYNGSTIATLNAGDTKTLRCNGKVMASNVGIGSKTLQCIGKIMATDVVVRVSGSTWEDPVQDGSNLSITQVYNATQNGSNLILE